MQRFAPEPRCPLHLVEVVAGQAVGRIRLLLQEGAERRPAAAQDVGDLGKRSGQTIMVTALDDVGDLVLREMSEITDTII
jgi:metal-dependent HD superfamily phosphatase/phosphodiesterase